MDDPYRPDHTREPHACTDAEVPEICVVRLEGRDRIVYAVAKPHMPAPPDLPGQCAACLIITDDLAGSLCRDRDACEDRQPPLFSATLTIRHRQDGP